LRGFASVRVPIGTGALVISDVGVFSSGDRTWASLPAKPLIGADGRHMTDDAGKKKYAPILSWSDRATSDRWSESVVDLVRTKHPAALGNSDFEF
jgi:hypothetical protein